MANNAPSGVIYDPEQDGTALISLGVHEHWNNETNKKYSRNLGIGNGIELIAITGNEVTTDINDSPEMNSDLKIYPNPEKRGSTLHFTGVVKKEKITVRFNQNLSTESANVDFNIECLSGASDRNPFASFYGIQHPYFFPPKPPTPNRIALLLRQIEDIS